jgi:Flp pilus assembly protein protease CpaA
VEELPSPLLALEPSLPEHLRLWWAALGVVLVVAVGTDLTWKRIPDWLTLPAGLGLLLARFVQEGPGTAGQGLLSGLLGAGLALGMFGAVAAWGRGLGWGDVKLAGVVGACFGFPDGLGALLLGSVVGAGQAAVWALWGARAAPASGAAGPGGGPGRAALPYSLAIAAGAFGMMWWAGSG